MSVPERVAGSPACPEFERLLVLHAWDELEPARRAAVDEHVAKCAACIAALERERRLVELVATAEGEVPSELFLADCRHALAERLGRTPAELGWLGRVRRVLAGVRPFGWVALHPGWSVALLILIGFLAGRGLPQKTSPGDATPAQPVFTPGDPSNPEITRIRPLPDNGGVEVVMRTERPLVVRGTASDRAIRLALLRALTAGQDFDPDVRLDSLDLLRPMRAETDVRQALCQAARSDSNPSVRLKAIEALRGLEQDEMVRQTLLYALLHDNNPGVRVEAVNSLRAFLDSAPDQAPQDERVMRVLADRKDKDPNDFVRMQSAAAFRQIASRKPY